MHTVAGVLLKGIVGNHYDGFFEHKKRLPAERRTEPKVRKALKTAAFKAKSKTVTLYQSYGLLMVEARGVEPRMNSQQGPRFGGREATGAKPATRIKERLLSVSIG